MLKIELENLHFFAYHGVHEEEKNNGGDFDVSVNISFEPRFFPIRYLDETIDYEKLYDVIKQRMMITEELLESVVTQMVQDILVAFPVAEEVTVKVKKHKPLINEFQGTAAAQYNWKRVVRNNR